MQPRIILDSTPFALTIERLCYQLIEHHDHFEDTCLIGIQPRGVHLSDRIMARLKAIDPKLNIRYGKLDITFYRDDFRQKDRPPVPSSTILPFSVEHKKVVLVDDVLYTGRTIRSAMDALMDYGRPARVELLALVDRRFSRDVPIRADYIGKTVDAIMSERVKVEWKETSGADKIWIMDENEPTR
jgi:pyrimidine operon attenuation protein / uracil phosphoribosyltransferase